ncbi:hypothetical protein DL89DRAFT_264389 [Linderina pennispora]|uniref:Uncharacterized protein n=1 Tax=Linderina pennispora TaxID=61395 RepID=A0A1Y1WM18_9FUNG|nr:uncharacterized protein DL89DRAFT_264389 [Linderina pennispora]ORX74542.1 hypothetical protein DL89DRAFT_264389 [Linderina pennispora]
MPVTRQRASSYTANVREARDTTRVSTVLFTKIVSRGYDMCYWNQEYAWMEKNPEGTTAP